MDKLCTSIKEESNARHDGVTTAYSLDLRSKLERLFGSENTVVPKLEKAGRLGKLALSEWRKMKDKLYDRGMRIGSEYNYDIFQYDPEVYNHEIIDYLSKRFRMAADPITLWKKATPRRILAISKSVNAIMSLQETRYGKKIPWFERALFPAVFFAMRFDISGLLYRFIQNSTNIVENARRYAAPYSNAYNDIMSSYRASIRTGLENLFDNNGGYWKAEDIMVNWIKREGIKVRNQHNDEVVWYGSIKQDDEVFHEIYDEESDSLRSVPEADLSRDELITAIYNKYTHELTHHMLSGRIRRVKWIDPEDLNDPKFLDATYIKEKINDIFRQMEWRRERGEVPSHRNYYTTEYNGKAYNYVIIKAHYQDFSYAVIVKHSDLEGKNPVKYMHIDKSGQVTSDKRGTKLSTFQAREDNVFRDGFYKSDDYRSFGTYWNEQGEITGYEMGREFSNLNNVWMPNQPSDALISVKGIVDTAKTGLYPGVKPIILDEAITKMRKLYERISKELKDKGKEEQVRVNRWFTGLGPDGQSRIQKALSKHFDVSTMEKLIEELRNQLNIGLRIYWDEDGFAHSINADYSEISEYYATRQFDNNDLYEMLTKTIEEFGDRISNTMPKTPVEEKKLKFDKRLLEEMKQSLSDMFSDDPHRVKANIASQNVFTKHRSIWTDPNKELVDGDIFDKYVNHMFQGFTRSDLMFSALEAIEAASKFSPAGTISKDMFEIVSNRIKMAYGDPEVKGGIGKLDYSYSRVASIMNKLPFSHGKHTAASVEQSIRFQRGILTATLLGATGAMRNRTQTINTFIKSGWRITHKAFKMLKDQPDMVKAIIDNSGIDELTNFWIEMLAAGGNIHMGDAGALKVPFTRYIHIPTRTLTDFWQLVRLDKAKAIKQGHPDIDSALLAMEDSRVDNLLKREKRRVTSEAEKRNIETLRKLFIELMVTPKLEDNAENRALLEKRFKALLGEVTNNRMRRMVSWKLTWWWDAFAPEMFTFTESERTMRKHSALVALLVAQEAGQLGEGELITKTHVDPLTGRTKSIEVRDIYLTDKAVSIMRNAVYNEMFGMSQVHTGEGMVGFGAHLGLFKSYSYNQMIHDHEVFASWVSGNMDAKDAMNRIFNALAYTTSRAWKGFFKGHKYSYDVMDKNVDADAIAVLRLMSTRFAISVLAACVESIATMRFMRKLAGYNMLIGGENPMFAIAIRVFLNTMLIASLDDDDLFEGKLLDVGWDIMRMLMPVIITLPLSFLFES